VVAEHRAEEPEVILERVLADVAAFGGHADDDCTLLILRI
jgi:serine phosphatase RsbU (regulator of sigma subunit)